MDETPIETNEARELRILSAHRAHDRATDLFKAQSEQTNSFGLAAMRAPALVSAGGIAAALGFYSANFNRLSEDPANLELFNNVIFWLFLSLLATVVAPGIGYFAQAGYASSLGHESYDYQHPFTHSTKGSRLWRLVGETCRWLAVATVVVSIGCLIRGGYLFLVFFK